MGELKSSCLASDTGARCGRAPEVRATNNAMTRGPRCQPGTAAASERTSEHNAALELTAHNHLAIRIDAMN
jgi:hypothetical protein